MNRYNGDDGDVEMVISRKELLLTSFIKYSD